MVGGIFLLENILKRGLIFYEGFMGGQGRMVGLRFFYGEGGVDMDIFV